MRPTTTTTTSTTVKPTTTTSLVFAQTTTNLPNLQTTTSTFPIVLQVTTAALISTTITALKTTTTTTTRKTMGQPKLTSSPVPSTLSTTDDGITTTQGLRLQPFTPTNNNFLGNNVLSYALAGFSGLLVIICLLAIGLKVRDVVRYKKARALRVHVKRISAMNKAEEEEAKRNGTYKEVERVHHHTIDEAKHPKKMEEGTAGGQSVKKDKTGKKVPNRITLEERMEALETRRENTIKKPKKPVLEGLERDDDLPMTGAQSVRNQKPKNDEMRANSSQSARVHKSRKDDNDIQKNGQNKPKKVVLEGLERDDDIPITGSSSVRQRKDK